MLTCLSLGTNRVRITDWVHTVFPGDDESWIHYNPVLKKRNQVRHVEYKLVGTLEQLIDLLSRYPAARIRHTLSHEPYISPHETEMIMGQLKTIQEVAAWKRVQDNGVDVIDEFGFHLYIRADIDFTGEEPDVDLRYQ